MYFKTIQNLVYVYFSNFTHYFHSSLPILHLFPDNIKSSYSNPMTHLHLIHHPPLSS